MRPQACYEATSLIGQELIEEISSTDRRASWAIVTLPAREGIEYRIIVTRHLRCDPQPQSAVELQPGCEQHAPQYIRIAKGGTCRMHNCIAELQAVGVRQKCDLINPCRVYNLENRRSRRLSWSSPK